MILRLDGVLLSPIDGASKVYQQLQPMWEGLYTIEAKAEKVCRVARVVCWKV